MRTATARSASWTIDGVLGDALARLYARVPLGMRLGLEPMREACARFGHPERAFESVHVAGTNGKGSVCAMVESIARASGRSDGPLHLAAPLPLRRAHPHRRVNLSTTPRSRTLLERALDGAPELSFFETATLAAFLAFRDAKVDLAIVEVGHRRPARRDERLAATAGRRDHAHRARSHRSARARPSSTSRARRRESPSRGSISSLGPMPADVRAAVDAVAHACGATTTSVDDRGAPARIGLEGEYQKDNARIASLLGERIGASAAAIDHGLASVRWPGRLERIAGVRPGAPSRGFLLDAAHNPDGAEALARHLRSLAVPPTEVALVFGTLGDKDVAGHARRAGSPCGHAHLRRSPRGLEGGDRTRLARRAPRGRRGGLGGRRHLASDRGGWHLARRRRGIARPASARRERSCWGWRAIRRSRFEDGRSLRLH